MKTSEELKKVYRAAAKGDEEAFSFLMLWHLHCHGIDDEVDEAVSAEQVVASRVLGLTIGVHPFWLRHHDTLLQTSMLIANDYADSEGLKDHPDPGLRQWADSLRLAGNQMVIAVALLCGGFDLARQISPRLREIAWRSQHEDSSDAIPTTPAAAA